MRKIQTFNYYQEKRNSLIEEIVAKSATLNQANPLFSKFIHKFYAHSSIVTLGKFGLCELVKLASESFEFFKFKDLAPSKIRIYTPCYIKENACSDYSILEINHPDMPFLIDSIKEKLTHDNVRIYEMLHPIIRVKRNEKGELLDIYELNAEEEGTILESLIHIHISLIKEEAIKNYSLKLLEIIKNVEAAVSDWPEMLAQIPAIKSNQDFLEWLVKDNFTFLGYAEYKSNIQTKKHGIVRLADFNYDLGYLQSGTNSLEIARINRISPVHRSELLHYIAIKTFDEDNNLDRLHVFIGLFTTAIYYQSVNVIPIIRDKVKSIIKNSGFIENSYSGKELASIIEALPRKELFELSEEELLDISAEIYALITQPKLYLYGRVEPRGDFLNCMLFVSRETFNEELASQVEKFIQANVGNIVYTKFNQINDVQVSYFYFVVDITTSKGPIDIAAIEESLKVEVNLWNEDLRLALISEFNESEGDLLYDNYKRAFPSAYREKFYAKSYAIIDINYIEKAILSKQIIFSIFPQSEADCVSLKLYSFERISLSTIMPILSHLGFKAIEETSFKIRPRHIDQNIWLHDFELMIEDYEARALNQLDLNLNDIKSLIEEALPQIYDHSIKNDGLNKLILRAGIGWRDISLLRSILKYIRQINLPYSYEYVEEVLVRHPKISKLLIELFYAMFDVNQQDSSNASVISAKFNNMLAKVVNSSEDKVLRTVYLIIKAMLRTNYFQQDNTCCYKDYISFKLDSKKVPDLPLPRPFAEIFVYSTRLEAIHLRGGKVARGGLRWSDRTEDFRTEVLGLMKAQMTKNSVIVPVGSKGGFVIQKDSSALTKAELLEEAKECYRIFLRGLLDITDNIVNGQVVRPKDVVCFDDEDPYLVVAADKGTATFSDIANAISLEYNFWLQDAFASGGSAGYDHKKMAITARGGWVSVTRHFTEMGVNIANNEFSVVGIGDMSGDVFGNGMLLSNNIKLLAAFNHLHIFIDPNPDSKTSFIERQRLFNLPTSNWTDYDPKLLSKGASIYDRKTKELELTPEIKELFKIETDIITPNDLIKKILTANVDLLWNGGIGTYVKSSAEVNEQVGDKTNDLVRVNGRDLNCKVVGEGGNLGFTQRGRIEFALKGGRINTDAIDNSAGVDCSDHEVNIKIAFSRALASGKLTILERNALLEQMTDEVACLVLRDNQLQTSSISLSETHGYSSLEIYLRLINKLESSGFLNPELEFLPNGAEFSRRNIARIGLVRPEIAVIMSYSKLTLYNEILASSLPEDPYHEKELINYFPKIMQESYREEIITHPLRREIIATIITNKMVNRMGSSLIYFINEYTGATQAEIARAFTITTELFDLEKLWNELESLEGKITNKALDELYNQVNKLVQRGISWLLRNLSENIYDIAKVVSEYKEGVRILESSFDNLLGRKIQSRFNEKYLYFKSFNIDEALVQKIIDLNPLTSALDIVMVSIQSGLSIEVVGSIYFKIDTNFHLDLLRHRVDLLSVDSFWQRLSFKAVKEDIYDKQRKLTKEITKFAGNEDAFTEWCTLYQPQVARYKHFFNELITQENVDFEMIVIAAKRFELLAG